MKLLNIFTPCYCLHEKNDIIETASEETGWDRVKRMYSKTPFGFLSPELNMIIKNSTGAISVAAVFGAFIHAHQAKDNFLRKNVETQFESQHLARRRLVDTVSLSAIKGGLKFGVKYGSFSSLYMLLTMTAANYNYKVTIWEHIGSGALLGSLFRINYGLKGMAAAGSAGAVLGALAGGTLLLGMWLTNTTFEEFHSWQNVTYLESRRRMFETKREDLIKP